MGPVLPAVLLAALCTPAEAARWDLAGVPPELDLTEALMQDDPGALETPAPAPARKRPYLMEVNFRGKWLSVPDSILDIWYFDEDDFQGHPARPDVRAWSAGIEWVIKNDTANGIFYFEYLGSLIEEGYWDDVEDPPEYDDGDYIVPDRLGLVAFGANYGQEIHANEWLSFLFGGGLGVLKITGQMTQWRPGSVDPADLSDPNCDEGDGTVSPTAPAYERYAGGCGDDGAKRIPEVLPIVDLNFAVRFNFNNRANLRLEGGLHDMLYVGAATGVVF